MLLTSTDRKWLPLYEALASEVRLSILDMLIHGETNVKKLAEQLGLSAAITSMHVRKLEQAGLITTRRLRREDGTYMDGYKLSDTKLSEIPIDRNQWTLKFK